MKSTPSPLPPKFPPPQPLQSRIVPPKRVIDLDFPSLAPFPPTFNSISVGNTVRVAIDSAARRARGKFTRSNPRISSYSSLFPARRRADALRKLTRLPALGPMVHRGSRVWLRACVHLCIQGTFFESVSDTISGGNRS